MGIDIDQFYQGNNNSFKAADIQAGTQLQLVIAGVGIVEFKKDDGSPDPKIEITFQNQEKTFVCNKTNAKTISAQHGTNTDNWIGKEIYLYSTTVDFGGKSVPAIRVNLPLKTV